jgi:hypothetical protein
MNLESLLADPSLDLPVPLDGLAQVDRRAGRIRRRRKALVAVPVIAAVAISGALLTRPHGKDVTLYGVTPTAAPHSPKLEQLTYCMVPTGTMDVDGPTGDPVVNCTAVWPTRAPALVAYQNSFGGVEVYARDADVPPDRTRLPSGVVQDPVLIELDEALQDSVDGMFASCLTKQQALVKARQVLDELRVHDWPVVLADPSPDSYPSPCWVAAGKPSEHTVTVGAGPNIAQNEVPYYEKMVAPLRASVHGCWTRAEALSQVHRTIDGSDFPAEARAGFAIRQVDDPSATCTTVHVTGGGNVVFTLRGPVNR